MSSRVLRCRLGHAVRQRAVAIDPGANKSARRAPLQGMCKATGGARGMKVITSPESIMPTESSMHARTPHAIANGP